MNKLFKDFLVVGYPVYGRVIVNVVETFEKRHAAKEEAYWKDLGIENIDGNEDWANAKDAA